MSGMSTLSDLKPGDTAVVRGFGSVSKTYQHQLLSMGLTPGTSFSLVRKAPLGDPVILFVRGFELSLRKNEAECLVVEKIIDES